MKPLKIVEYLRLSCGCIVDVAEHEARTWSRALTFVCPKCNHTEQTIVARGATREEVSP
jgi:hypothetical protein